MKYLSIITVALAISLSASAQKQSFKTDHTYNVGILGKAKDSLFTAILRQYDFYLHQNPEDARTHLERCKFIQKAYYDEYEDYNPKEEEAEACAQQLVAHFPNDPEALIFATEFIYGDSSLTYLNTLTERIESESETWKPFSWMVYQQLAQYHHYNDEDNTEVIRYATLAMNENDTLDLSILLATAHKNLNQKEEAIAILLTHLDSTSQSWELNQKGNLLLELGAPEKALEAFRFAARDTTGYSDLSSTAQAMIDNGLIAEARDYLLKDYNQNTWNRIKPLHRLLEYDLTYATPDSAALTYDRFVADNFWNDALGIYRWRLFIKSPLHGWTLSDLGRVFMLLLTILVIGVIPYYLWILPIHYFGEWQRSRGRIFPASSFNWGLRHLWLACSLWIFCDFLVSLVLDYPGILSLLNSNLESTAIESVSKGSANFLLLFCVASLFFTTTFLKKDDVLHFVSTIRKNGRAILTGIGLAFGLRFGLGIYIQLLKLFDIRIDSGVTTMASITDSIVSVNQFYSPYLGFLLVVILVPFYEEVLFRGIFLSACERNMKFIFANILQSAVFALVHNDLKLAPFYFAFGMVAGNYRQRTQGLLTGTSMHATNNLIAFAVITALRG